MFIALGHKFFEVGDEVIQKRYVGCRSVVQEVIESKGSWDETAYRVRIDATGHPEAFDENDNPENLKFACIPASELSRDN